MKRAAAICALAGSLAGCGGGGENFFTAPAGGGGSTFGNLLAFNTADPGPIPAASAHEAPLQCPQIEVLDGTSSYRTYAGGDQSNGNVRYQYAMVELARECSKSGNQILIKVGVAGRVLLGPAGQTGSFTVPVRIAVRRDSDQKAAAVKLYNVPATIAFGQTQGEFTIVSDPLAVPFIQAHADDDYTILVGFDAHPAADAKPARLKSKRQPG